MKEPYIRVCRERLDSERRTGTKPKLHASFAALVRSCRPPPNVRPRSYEGLAQEIVRRWRGDRCPVSANPKYGSADVSGLLAELARARSHTILEPLLEWLWDDHPVTTRADFEAAGVDFREADAAVRNASAAVVARADESSFSLEYLFEIAKRQITLVAQVNWYLLSPDFSGKPSKWPLIEAALRRGVDVEIAAMHPDVRPAPTSDEPTPDAIELWCHYQKSPEFREHVEKCWGVLERWIAIYKSLVPEADLQLGAFRVYRTYFEPLSMSIVDPDEDSGLLILSPRNHDARATARPQFVLHKQSDQVAFGYFWDGVRTSPANFGWRLTL